MDGFLHHEWVKLFMINASKLKWLSVLQVDIGQYVLSLQKILGWFNLG